MSKVIVIGIDAAFANMGLVRVLLDLVSLEFEVLDMNLVKTEGDPTKQLRKSSSTLSRAKLLRDGLVTFCQEPAASFAFAEVPSGSQSSAASHALGVAVGVLAGCPVPLIEVTPMDVKHLFSTNRPVSKAEIIQWAVEKYPTAPWLKTKRKGKMELTKDNEHLADAIATVTAGVKSKEFQLIRAMQNATPSNHHDRPAPRRERVRIVSVESLSPPSRKRHQH